MAASEVRCPKCDRRNRLPVVAAGRARCGACQADLPWIVDATTAEFSSVVERSSLPVLVDLWAPWCAPCRAVAPVLEQLARDRPGALRIVKVNVDEEPDVSQQLGVQGIPTMVLFSGGREVGRRVGALPAHEIRAWIDGATAEPGV